jgi:predicted 3-demethylubiquinone-9 3-methyltransferase (glyoxalase superfamily)
MATLKHKLTPSLWFKNEARQAAKFYVSIFPGSKITNVTTLHDTPGGDCDIVSFVLSGQPFMAFDTKASLKFNESISFTVFCDTQKEIDHYWKKLSADPKAEICNWVKDKFGVSWQITPSVLPKMQQQGTRAQVDRVTQAFMKMKKFDIAELKRAYAGK